MEINRRAAMLAGKNKYFTGKPCKNGHTSYRYVLSGACFDCIRAQYTRVGRIPIEARLSVRLLESQKAAQLSESIKEGRIEALKKYIETQNIRKEFVSVKVPIIPTDLDTVTALVWAYASSRISDVTIGEFKPERVKDVPGLYRIECHVEDRVALLDSVTAIYDAGAPKITPPAVKG